MAKLFADASGQIVRLLQTAAEEARWGASHPDAAHVLPFDPTTNPHILEGLESDWNAHAMAGGVLTRDGIPVPIHADSQAHQDRQALASLREKLEADAPLSPQELRRLLRHLIRYL
jgi:glutamate formiminotransferase